MIRLEGMGSRISAARSVTTAIALPAPACAIQFSTSGSTWIPRTFSRISFEAMIATATEPIRMSACFTVKYAIAVATIQRTIRSTELPAGSTPKDVIGDLYDDRLDVIVARGAMPAAPLAAAGESLDRDDADPGW